jgi:hypothetical protein
MSALRADEMTVRCWCCGGPSPRVIDSIVVTRARGESQGMSGSLQSLCWGSVAVVGHPSPPGRRTPRTPRPHTLCPELITS